MHEYDTLDRDLERLGMTMSRIPLEAGAVWRLSLPHGEQVEAWVPGNHGLTLPQELMHLIGSVVAGKVLVPAPPQSRDPGALRLPEMIDEHGWRCLLTIGGGRVLDQDGYRLLLARLRRPPRLAPDVDGIPLERIARAEFRRLARAIERLGKHPSDARCTGSGSG